MRVLKFLTVGAIGISVNLGIFHALYVIGVPYLIGSVCGLLVAMVIGFLLQKYWTFENYAFESLRVQFVLYAGLALGNLVLNTGIVYVLVGRLGVFYLSAQAMGALVIAVDSYFMYHFYIFRREEHSSESPKS